MKKNILLAILFSCFSISYSQECCDRMIKQAIQMDSLQKKLSSEKGIFERNLQTLNDSITRLVNAHKVEISTLSTQLKKLENDTTNLHKQLRGLDKKKLESYQSQLRQKTDSISLLKGTIIQKSAEVVASEQECIKKYAEGQANVYNEISSIYKIKTFEELILFSTKQSVERDLLLVGDDALAKQKLENLKIYFDARSILEDRFDAQNLRNAQIQLNSIKENSTSIARLNKSLESYEQSNTALKETISKIMEIDRKLIAKEDEYIQGIKIQDILGEFTSYFYNNGLGLNRYPYLSKIIIEIMNIKRENPDANIDYFLSKL